MRRSRRLTRSDRWDIGLMVLLFSVALLCLAAMWRMGELPRVFAFASDAPSVHKKVLPLPNNVGEFALQRDLSNAVVNRTVFVPLPAALPAMDLPENKNSVPVPTKRYAGDTYRYLKTVRMRVTAYSPDEKCCWPYPGTTTASGLSVKTNHGKLVAADTRVLPMHSLVSVPGYHSGEAVPVLDRGGAIKGSRLDVLLPTYAQAQQWGAKMIDVKVYVPVDE